MSWPTLQVMLMLAQVATALALFQPSLSADTGFCDHSEVVSGDQTYSWPETVGGPLVALPCHTSTGHVTRVCRSGDQGWLPMNLSQCEVTVLQQLMPYLNDTVSVPA